MYLVIYILDLIFFVKKELEIIYMVLYYFLLCFFYGGCWDIRELYRI